MWKFIKALFHNITCGKRPSWSELKTDYIAAKSGQVRIHPHGVRGRVYKEENQPATIVHTRTNVQMRAQPTAIYRKSEDKWYRPDGTEITERNNG